MADRDELISQFADVTGVDTERARFYLESSAWKLEVALASFYENGDDNPVVLDDDPLEEEPVQVKMDATSKPKMKSKSNSRFATVASLNQSDSSDEEEGQAFYAGGSEHSGQQVLGPGKKKKDFVTEMFKSVQEHGAEVVDPKHPTPGRKPKFGGTGYRLGQTSNDSEVIGDPSSSARSSFTDITLKLWREGFSINDGPVREYADPQNKEFLDSIRKGEIPMELIHEANGSEVHVNMEDHRHEDYVPSKNKVRAFTGKGHLLGSPSPATIGITKPMDEKDKSVNEEHAKAVVAVNSSLPTTSIQIRLADGSRLLGQFNHSHTIADVRRFITTKKNEFSRKFKLVQSTLADPSFASGARPQYEHQNFTLLTTFPSKLLSDDSETLDKAGILNAAILQRLT